MNSTQFHEKILSIQDNMFNFAMILTGNRDDAGDLLQETVLKALNNQEKYIDNINFKGWILTIMRNIFINNYRKIIRSQTIIDQTEDLYHLNLSQDSGFDSPDGAYTIKEINIAINNLNTDLKIPFSMFLAGYKYHEIADKLILPLGTVKSRIFFARKELQKTLKDMR
ncbi:MAG: RNA polymerase sigma factor [Dysgonamonadaceae bacterium]|nr:RNA polymerase sigma factor [Dysgonamonadaceae bacterium]